MDEGKQAYRQRPLRFAQAEQWSQQSDHTNATPALPVFGDAPAVVIVVEDTTPESNVEEDVFADASTELVADTNTTESVSETAEQEENPEMEDDKDEHVGMDRVDR